MIDITYTIDRAEYVEAQKLFMRQRAKKRRTLRIVLFCVLVGSLFIFFWSTTNPRQALLVTACAALAGLVAGFLARYIIQLVTWRTRFKTESRLLTNVHITLDDNEFRSETSGIGQGTMAWEAFTSWLEGSHVFVLIIGYLFRPIPKHALSGPEAVELQNLLDRKIGPKGSIRKV